MARRPSPAMIVAVIALVMATVGTGYAALKLPKNAVGTKQLKKNSVTTAKIKKNAVTGAKVKKQTLTGSDINLKKLGTVPSAETANTVPPREGIHVVGAAGEPGFEAGASNYGPGLPGTVFPSAAFFKDHDDVVHLEGVVKAAGAPRFVFTLPAGFRPASGTVEIYETLNESAVIIAGSNTFVEGLDLSGKILATKEQVLLSGITFRAQS
jgi:hypothetical protein